MNLLESLGDLVLRCEAAGTADITTVATLIEGARGAGYFANQIEKGPDDPPAPTPSAVLSDRAIAAAKLEAVSVAPAPVAASSLPADPPPPLPPQ
jgi:hypothetical protein